MQVADVEHELQEAFRVFDQEATGFVTTADMHTILRGISDGLSEDEISEILAIVDSDGAGRVSFSQFAALMMGSGDQIAGRSDVDDAAYGAAGAASALEAADPSVHRARSTVHMPQVQPNSVQT